MTRGHGADPYERVDAELRRLWSQCNWALTETPSGGALVCGCGFESSTSHVGHLAFDAHRAWHTKNVTPPHGRANTYRKHGCRCDECCRANTDRQRTNGASRAHAIRNYARRRFVDGRWVAPVPEAQHGRYDTYDRHGCRCDECRRAGSEYRAAWRARRSAS